MSNLSVNTITDASGGSTASINGLTPQASNMQPFNRIINGAMTVDQRNAGASVTPTGGIYTLDRWRAYTTAASKFSVQQSSSAPLGFKNSALITSLSAFSISSTEEMIFFQKIEGANVYDLGWGTADAKQITLLFWVRSSLTGTFGGALRNGAADRSYPFAYTILSANTWEQKSVNISGDTSGTWLTTNGVGIEVLFSIGTGASSSGTAGAWASASHVSATGSTSLVGTSGATFYITGVQLEAGSTASSFAHENYSDTLQKCQRYYEKSYDINTVAGTNTFSGAIRFRTASTSVEAPLKFTQTKRATPTVTPYSIIGPSGNILNVSTGTNATAAVASIGQSGCFVAKDTGGTDEIGRAHV